jgi:protein O-GlcNAc transferase
MFDEMPDDIMDDGYENSKPIGIEYFQSGVERFLEGMNELARQDFLLSLEFDPSLILSYCYLSSIYNDEDDPDTSIELCKKGLLEEPDNAHLHFCLGSSYDLKGMKGAAIKEYLIYFNEFPDDAECVFSIANAYDDLEDLERAKRYYQRTVELDPEHHKAYFNWSLLEGASGNELEAVNLLKQAVKVDPDYWKAWVKLGVYCSKVGNVQEAILAYRNALKLSPDLIDVHYNLGISYKISGQPERAAKCFNEVVSRNDEDVNAWHNLGVTSFQAGETEEALKAFRTAISLDLNHAEAHYRLACVYITTGENEKARNEMIFLKSIDNGLYGAVEEMLETAMALEREDE